MKALITSSSSQSLHCNIKSAIKHLWFSDFHLFLMIFFSQMKKSSNSVFSKFCSDATVDPETGRMLPKSSMTMHKESRFYIFICIIEC